MKVLLFYKDYNMELYYDQQFTILKNIDGIKRYPFLKYNLESKRKMNVVLVIEQLLTLVESYHQNGKIMGNLNLHTIWFCQDELIYVGDCIGETKSKYCEKNYSSPEMISRMRLPGNDIRIDFQSDIYALGKILAYLNERFKLQLDKIIKKCTQLIKLDRYHSIQEIRRDLGKQKSYLIFNQQKIAVDHIDQANFQIIHNSIQYNHIDIFKHSDKKLIKKIYEAILFEIEYSNEDHCMINLDRIIYYYQNLKK